MTDEMPMSVIPARLRPVFAAVLLGVASAPLGIAMLENGNGSKSAQRQAHVELQAFQYRRVSAAMATTQSANRPGPAPLAVTTLDPTSPAYRWLLTRDVPSAPRALPDFEPDPVHIAFMAPIAPMGVVALTE